MMRRRIETFSNMLLGSLFSLSFYGGLGLSFSLGLLTSYMMATLGQGWGLDYLYRWLNLPPSDGDPLLFKLLRSWGLLKGTSSSSTPVFSLTDSLFWKVLSVVIFLLFAGLVVAYLSDIFQRAPKAKPSGLLLEAGTSPPIEALIAQVARELKVPAPDQVYLSPFPEAGAGEYVTSTGYVRTLLLGWPLIRFLPKALLAAVIAHELSHFDNRAFSVFRAFWRIESIHAEALSQHRLYRRRTDHRSARFEDQSLNNLWTYVYFFLLLYIRLYTLTTRPLRHAFELHCDRQSAKLYGANVFANALKEVLMLQISFELFKGVVGRKPRGEVPPRFYDLYMTHHAFLKLNGMLGQALAKSQDQAGLDHPSLERRLEKLAKIPERTAEVGYLLSLSPDDRALEQRLVSELYIR